MTYTQFVSTMNHIVAAKGYIYVIENWEDWFTPETLTEECIAYGIGLIEYCCHRAGMQIPWSLRSYQNVQLAQIKYPESVDIMVNVLGVSYLEECRSRAIKEFMNHNVLVMEVGNAV